MQDSKSVPTLSLQQMSIEAKRRRKQNQVKHSVALEQIARESGYQSYYHAQQVLSASAELMAIAAQVGRTPTRRYQSMPFSRIAERPFKVAALETHRMMASIIFAVMHFAEDRLRPSVKQPLELLRSDLDDWIEYEHQDDEGFTLAVRNEVYYKHREISAMVVYSFRDISDAEQSSLCGKLDELSHLLRSSYGDCGPVEDAIALVERSKKYVKKWHGASVARTKRRQVLNLPDPVQRVRSYADWSRLGSPRKDRRSLEPKPVEDISAEFKSPLQIVQNAIRLVKHHLTERRGRIPRRLPELLVLRRDLPYVLQGMSSPGVVLVNRDYKPCGHPKSEGYLKYEDFTAHHVVLTDAEVLQVVEPGRVAGLFGDGSAPWHLKANARAYLKRLERLESFIEMRSNSGLAT